jgi:hypothetical protein
VSTLSVNTITNAAGGNTAQINGMTPTADSLHDLFAYADGKLYWKVSRNPLKDFVGKVAGSSDGHGYLSVSINRRKHSVHRVVWQMFNGPIPAGYQIDHINGISTDNRIENLRLATNSQNGMNKGHRSDSSSPCKNVTWNKQQCKWKVKVQGKHIGSFEDLELADLVAAEARQKYQGAFARSM